MGQMDVKGGHVLCVNVGDKHSPSHLQNDPTSCCYFIVPLLWDCSRGSLLMLEQRQSVGWCVEQLEQNKEQMAEVSY